MNNLQKCNDCNEWMIAQEIKLHKCFSKLDNMLFDTDGTYSFDGIKWYRWFSPNFKHPNGTPKRFNRTNFFINIRRFL